MWFDLKTDFLRERFRLELYFYTGIQHNFGMLDLHSSHNRTHFHLLESLCPVWCKTGLNLLQATVKQGIADQVPRLGAALAFYAMLSLMPMLALILLGLTALYGSTESGSDIHDSIAQFAGARQADAVQQILDPLLAAHPGNTGFLAAASNLVILFFGATGLFNQLQDVMNFLWRIPARKEKALNHMIRERLFSFLIIVSVGLILIASIAANAAIGFALRYATSIVPVFARIAELVTWLINFGFMALVFALAFKIIPDQKIRWGDVGWGALFTALLFSGGQFLIGFYLGHAHVMDGYGAAGSLVALLIWIYYSAQICFFGAEFTQIYAHRFGSRKEAAHSFPGS